MQLRRIDHNTGSNTIFSKSPKQARMDGIARYAVVYWHCQILGLETILRSLYFDLLMPSTSIFVNHSIFDRSPFTIRTSSKLNLLGREEGILISKKGKEKSLKFLFFYSCRKRSLQASGMESFLFYIFYNWKIRETLCQR